MLEATQLIGFGSGLQPGPYSLTYAGSRAINGAASGSFTFDLGPKYLDRLVFVSILNAAFSSVTVGGTAGTFLTGNYSYGWMEWWVVRQPPGTTGVPVSVALTSTTSAVVTVHVLGGGAGLTPTVDTVSASANNSNSIFGYFPTAALVGDMVLAAGMKSASTAFTGFNSNMAPYNYDSGTLVAGGSGVGVASVGPVTSGIAAGSAYVQAVGGDSSKSIQVCAIKIRKAV